jgi:DNA-binding NarL/FixJ family response regulator
MASLPRSVKKNSRMPSSKIMLDKTLAIHSLETDLPLAPISKFSFGFESLFFYKSDQHLYDILKVKDLKLVNNNIYYFFRKVVTKDHLDTVNELFAEALKYLEKKVSADFIFNLDFNTVSSANDSARVLLQMKKNNEGPQSKEQIVEGQFIDLSYYTMDGPPRLTIIKNNKVVAQQQGNPLVSLQKLGIQLNSHQLKVLREKSKGLNAAAIAKNVHLSRLTVYSIIRDIKKNTGMDTIPLINLLKEKKII